MAPIHRPPGLDNMDLTSPALKKDRRRNELGRILPPPRDEAGRPIDAIGASNVGQQKRGELRKALYTADTPGTIRQIGQILIARAMSGDVPAARLYLDHVIGKPTASVEISGPDGGPIPMVKVVQAIMVALGNDPDSQAKVGQALRMLELGGKVEPPESPADPLPPRAARMLRRF